MNGQGQTAPISIVVSDRARTPLRPAVRRAVYVGGYELFGALFTSFVLGSLLGHGGGESTITAILVSLTATAWNYAWNSIFEWAERRFSIKGRGPLMRVVQAIGYEGGLLIFTVPLVAFLLHVGLLEALMIESGLLVFFLVYTYVYSWVFDKIFGLPESAK
ncbi:MULTISPECIES: PACE efflux transporter [unclassified Leucobacter]|uniref:PACE efflux transporter n=1 Tax=unclassified Leucobacter TaxID=2621730 RepID=UPI0019D1A747|nr:PACE efflux transporter [Leucobacter sp. CX169]